LKEGKLKEEA